MSGVKGRSGTNKNKDKPWRDALMLSVKEAEGDQKKLRLLADKLVAKALEGDVSALKEIGDRLDGKPAQAIIGGDDDDNPVSHIHRIEMVALHDDSDGSPTA